MKIAFLTVDRAWRVATIFDSLRIALAAIPGVDVVEFWRPRWEQSWAFDRSKQEPVLTVDEASKYDWILSDAPFAFCYEAWDQFDASTAVVFEDLHRAAAEYIRFVFDAGVGHFLVRYRDAARRQHPYLWKRSVFWTPHCVDPAVFHPYERDEDLGVLLTGSMGAAYPKRKAWDADCCARLTGPGQYERVPRPVEGTVAQWPRDGEYAMKLSQARIALATGSELGYVVKKYLEIPACGAALAAEWLPEMVEMGFVPGVNMIEIKGERPAQDLARWLRSPSLPDIAALGRGLVMARHTAAVRARELLDYLEAHRGT